MNVKSFIQKFAFDKLITLNILVFSFFKHFWKFYLSDAVMEL